MDQFSLQQQPVWRSANVSLNQFLLTPNNWPWLPGDPNISRSATRRHPPKVSVLPRPAIRSVSFYFTAPTSVTSTAPNPTVQVVWGVTNQGPASASGYGDRTVWFSSNGVLDANSIDVGNSRVSHGACQWKLLADQHGDAADDHQREYVLFVQVDAGNYIYDSNLANNVSAPVTGLFTLTPQT